MYLDSERRIIFHANPRTGSRAIAEAMTRVGAINIGSHHVSMSVKPIEGWTVFSVVRPHHEVLASFYGKVTMDSVATHKKTQCHNRRFGIGGSDMYWRSDYCTEILQYPDLRIPGYNDVIDVVGKTNKGASWRENTDREVIKHIRSFGPWVDEYERYGWELPN